MLREYWDAYTQLDDGQHGPDLTDATTAVLGTHRTSEVNDYWAPECPAQNAERQKELRWYRYLFSNRSKPMTHLSALNRMTHEQKANPPRVLKALLGFAGSKIEP